MVLTVIVIALCTVLVRNPRRIAGFRRTEGGWGNSLSALRLPLVQMLQRQAELSMNWPPRPKLPEMQNLPTGPNTCPISTPCAVSMPSSKLSIQMHFKEILGFMNQYVGRELLRTMYKLLMPYRQPQQRHLKRGPSGPPPWQPSRKRVASLKDKATALALPSAPMESCQAAFSYFRADLGIVILALPESGPLYRTVKAWPPHISPCPEDLSLIQRSRYRY